MQQPSEPARPDPRSAAEPGRAGPRVAVGIVSFDCAGHVVTCLRALQASRLSPSVIHVCENAGARAYAALVEATAQAFGAMTGLEEGAAGVLKRTDFTLGPGGPRITVHLAGDNLGYAGGVNLCVRALRGAAWDGVLVLNPDATVAPDAIEAFASHARRGGYGVVGGRLLFADTGRVQMFGGRWRPWVARAVNLGLDEPADARPDVPALERQLDYVCGGAMYVTRTYCDAVGPMDEDYFLYMEEVDYCFRRGPFPLGYAHDAVVVHLHGAATGASRDARVRSPLTIYLSERNRLRFTRRFFPARYPVVVATTFCMTLLYLRRAGPRQFAVALAGWVAGVLGETGRPRRVPS